MKSYKKICTKCGFIYSKKKQSCDECGSRLSVYSEEYANYGTDNNKDGKIFGLAALIPIIVITLGLIILGVLKDEITANVGLIFGGLIISILGAFNYCNAETSWYLEYGWKFKDAEPSDFALGMIRFFGGAAYIGGIIAIFVGLLS
jgi:hypothetical protein